MHKETQFYNTAELESLKKSDIKKLAGVLQYHSDLYYNKEAPIISDSEYDILLKKLEALEEKFGLAGKYSQKVGDEVVESSFEKVAHTRPMISLGNTYNTEDLLDFDTRVKKNIGNGANNHIEYCLEYKFDGLGIELIYIDGHFSQAITRGNGIEGEDVTENIRTIKNIPKTINYTDYLEVRGEVVMPISVFQKLNEKAKAESGKIFSNPRNAASGSVRMKDSSVTAERALQFFAYDLGNFEEYVTHQGLKSYKSVIQNLSMLGFEISSFFESYKNISDLAKKIENIDDYKSGIDFEVDGLVLKVNDIELWQSIGFTEHHPKYAIAYKFPAEIFSTTILSVDHQVGRTGTITPAANLEAVNIGGAMIRRATLHNYDEVDKLDVKIGDQIFIKRAGEVIPKVISVAGIDDPKRSTFTPISPPKNCPSCNTEIIKDGEKVRFFCPNKSCPKQISEQLIYAVGKSGLNIDGLGTRQIEIFLEHGIITDLASIFEIEHKTKEILTLEGFKEKSVENLLKGISSVRSLKIDTLVRSLGIEGVGKKTAKNLASLFSDENDILYFPHSIEEIQELPDLGPEVANNVFEFFHNQENKALLKKLTQLLEIEYYKKLLFDENSFFSGKTVCITGSFEYNGEKISRDQLIELLEQQGGSFTGSVSKKTDYLLAGEKAGSKLKKAQDLGVSILDIIEFYGHIN